MKLIVAVDACWAIGKDGDQLCYIPPISSGFSG